MKNRIFEYGNMDETAYLNWRTNRYDSIWNMHVLAEGYMDASKILVDKCLEDNEDKKADVIVFPILFTFNHGIELYAKSLFCSLNLLLGYKFKVPESHDIRRIWFDSKEKIKQFGFDSDAGRGEDEFKSMISVLENYLNELYRKVADGRSIEIVKSHINFSRYPMSTNNTKYFYIEKNGNEVVSLFSLRDTILDVEKSLSSLSGYYHELAIMR